MPVTSRRWAARLSTVVLAIAVCSASPSAVVWCHGADGHVRLEAAGAGCCGHAAETRMPEAPRQLGEHSSEADGVSGSGCGSCLDVPLRLGADVTLTLRVAAAAAPATAVVAGEPGIRAATECEAGSVLARGSPPALTVLRL